ncbi:MAG: hypothetical protein H0V42_13145 [Nocardioidaceae bacterium]|nr:hypothetical protein [Nocardioidaceae bacterium]
MPQHAFHHDEAEPGPGACGHETRTSYSGVLHWECWACGYASVREPGEREGRMEQRLEAARDFAESQERRTVSYAMSGRY